MVTNNWPRITDLFLYCYEKDLTYRNIYIFFFIYLMILLDIFNILNIDNLKVEKVSLIYTCISGRDYMAGLVQAFVPSYVPSDCWSSIIQHLDLKLNLHQTADQPTTNADQFLWLGRVWSGKKLPALIEERIYPRSTPAVSALYPWCTHA